jgi:hypothetical protein
MAEAKREAGQTANKQIRSTNHTNQHEKMGSLFESFRGSSWIVFTSIAVSRLFTMRLGQRPNGNWQLEFGNPHIGASTMTSVPDPLLWIDKVPPICSARSRMLVRPKWPSSGQPLLS